MRNKQFVHSSLFTISFGLFQTQAFRCHSPVPVTFSSEWAHPHTRGGSHRGQCRRQCCNHDAQRNFNELRFQFHTLHFFYHRFHRFHRFFRLRVVRAFRRLFWISQIFRLRVAICVIRINPEGNNLCHLRNLWSFRTLYGSGSGSAFLFLIWLIGVRSW